MVGLSIVNLAIVNPTVRLSHFDMTVNVTMANVSLVDLLADDIVSGGVTKGLVDVLQ